MSVPDNGAVLGGKYIVLSTLGRGGMGTVLRAKNKLTGKEVALKWMHSSASLSSEAAARLLREAEAASRLNHPNVVNVFDVMYEGETLFLVMELLEGETLRAYLNRESTPKITSLIAMLLPAMHGVAAAHDRGVIHRDLKPDNIFLVRGHGSTGALHAKVVDFGVAKVLNSEGMTLTRTGTSIGTPLYMSLEQLRADEDIDQRTDVYAFGVILYEAITGRLPYTATTLTEFAIKVATTSATPIKQLRPDVPTTLANVVEWAIARNREDRLESMAALIRELEPFAQEHSFRAELSDPGLTTPQLAAAPEASADSLRETTKYATPNTLPFTREHAAPRPKRPRRMIFAAGALLSLMAALIYWLQNHRQVETPQQLVRPASITDRSAATQPSAADTIEHTDEPLPSARDGFEPPPIDPPARAPQTQPVAAPAPHISSDKPAKRAQPRPTREPRTEPPPKPKPRSLPKPTEEAEPDLNNLGGRL